MIKVYSLNPKGERKLLSTFTDERSKAAKDYAEQRARRTKEDHLIIYADGEERVVFGDLSRMPF